jgi:hypothetical protein
VQGRRECRREHQPHKCPLGILIRWARPASRAQPSVRRRTGSPDTSPSRPVEAGLGPSPWGSTCPTKPCFGQCQHEDDPNPTQHG